MSGIGTGYDLSTTTYSPDGKVFQVEYACKAVENGGLAIGCKCKDGVVVAVEKLVQSKMLVPGTNKRIHAVSKHAGMAGTGLVPDVRTVVDRAREEAANYLSFYGDAIPANVLADRMAHYYHLFTLYWSVRPFGASVILATKDSNGYHMYVLEPSGECHKMNGCAIGKNKAAAKTEIEKLKFGEVLAKDCVKELARVIYIKFTTRKIRILSASWDGFARTVRGSLGEYRRRSRTRPSLWRKRRWRKTTIWTTLKK